MQQLRQSSSRNKSKAAAPRIDVVAHHNEKLYYDTYSRGGLRLCSRRRCVARKRNARTGCALRPKTQGPRMGRILHPTTPSESAAGTRLGRCGWELKLGGLSGEYCVGRRSACPLVLPRTSVLHDMRGAETPLRRSLRQLVRRGVGVELGVVREGHPVTVASLPRPSEAEEEEEEEEEEEGAAYYDPPGVAGSVEVNSTPRRRRRSTRRGGIRARAHEV